MVADERIAKIGEWLNYLLDRTEMLNDWERNFVESVSDQFDHKGDLTPKQEVLLKEIWEKN